MEAPLDRTLGLRALRSTPAVPVGVYGLPTGLELLLTRVFRTEGLQVVEVKYPLAFLYEERAEGRRGVLVVALSRTQGHRLIRHLSVHHPSSVIVAATTPMTRGAVAAAKASGVQFVVDGQTESMIYLKAMAQELTMSLERRRPARTEPAEDVESGPPLSDDQVLWLQALSEEVSIESLARRFYMSPRTMHRVLDVLYRDLGVKGRISAVLWAERHGLLSR